MRCGTGREHKQVTRQRIIEAASRWFKTDGIAALMADAGLINDAFYAHFDSKDDLVATTVAQRADLGQRVIRAGLLPLQRRHGDVSGTAERRLAELCHAHAATTASRHTQRCLGCRGQSRVIGACVGALRRDARHVFGSVATSEEIPDSSRPRAARDSRPSRLCSVY